MRADARLRRGIGIGVIVAVLIAGLVYGLTRGPSHHPQGNRPPSTTAPATSVPSPGGGGEEVQNTFSYGFDFSNQAPDAPRTNTAANDSARGVLQHFRGSVMDTSIYGFGLSDPEPSPGQFNMNDLAQRLSLIEEAGGVPVISLVGAPAWMRGGRSAAAGGGAAGGGSSGSNAFFRPPSAAHYQDFGALCAHIAQAFPSVRYFVVWNEMKGFYTKDGWNYRAYTSMYNDVYRAIKAVRPDAQVGGPYAVMTGYTSPPHHVVSTINGGAAWGYVDQGMLDTVTYWLQHKVGADFIAVDGATMIAKSDDPGITDPVSASHLYGAVDTWIRSQTSLPIWWMESHIQPTTGWSSQQSSAARIAVLVEMAATGASVGLQWQPQEQDGWADQGLWTSTLTAGGGEPTTLAKQLQVALPVLQQGVSIVTGQPPGVVVAAGRSGTLLVNTLDRGSHAVVGGATVALAPGEVLVR